MLSLLHLDILPPGYVLKTRRDDQDQLQGFFRMSRETAKYNQGMAQAAGNALIAQSGAGALLPAHPLHFHTAWANILD